MGVGARGEVRIRNARGFHYSLGDGENHVAMAGIDTGKTGGDALDERLSLVLDILSLR